MNNIILAGDSIFDNESYVKRGQPAVIDQLNDILDKGSKATLIAIDGDVTSGVKYQLEKLQNDSTHLFISAGGNDALHNLHKLTDSVHSIGEGFLEFYEIRKSFEESYTTMLSNALLYDLPTVVCSIYHPCFDNNESDRVSGFIPSGMDNSNIQKSAVTALSIFNDIIFQEAAKNGIPVMDLRLIFSENSDYANPIEPSALGGAKMVKRMKNIIDQHDWSLSKSVIYN